MEPLKTSIRRLSNARVLGLALGTAWVALLAGGPAQAAVMTWSFTGVPVASTGGTFNDGNTMTFQSTDPSATLVRVSAWADTGTGNVFQTGNLRRWSTGLGEYNQAEPDSALSYTHTFDNFLHTDFALFEFDRMITVNTVTLSMWSGNTGQSTKDGDITVWAGTIADVFNTPSNLTLAGETFPDLDTLLGSAVDNNGSASGSNGVTRVADLSADGLNGNVVILAASRTMTGLTDRYKIKAMTATKYDVPEPATLAIFLFGLAGVGLIRRRRAA